MVKRRKKRRTRPPRSTARSSQTASRAKKQRWAELGRSGPRLVGPKQIVAEGEFRGAYMLDSLREDPQTQLSFVFERGNRTQAMCFLLEYPAWGVKNFFITRPMSWAKMERALEMVGGGLYPLIEIPFAQAKALLERMLEINAKRGLYHRDYRADENFVRARILEVPAEPADISDLMGDDEDRLHVVDMRNWEETMSEMVP